MCASRTATGGALVSFVALLAGYNELGARYPDLPEGYGLGLLAAGFVLVGVFWFGVDALRWRRVVRSLGFEYAGVSPGETALATLETYQRSDAGRTIPAACRAALGSAGGRRTETPVSWVDATIRVRRPDFGGIPESDLPERVPVSVEGIEDEYRVYATDVDLADDLVRTPGVRDAIVAAGGLKELTISDGYARTVTRGRVFDTDCVQRYIDVVRETAGALEDLDR